MSDNMPRLPDDTQRLTIVGKTGEGKSQAAMWHLSRRNFHLRPWIIFDWKYDELINSIKGFQHVPIGYIPGPHERGVFVVHPTPDLDDEIVESYMWAIHKRGNVGVYIDEGYMVKPRNPAYNALLTQGRSKRIPMINLSQRPAWVSRFVVSEAEFFQVFWLNDINDRKKIQEFMPIKMARLDPYHSYYYDVGRDKMHIFEPVPDRKEIIKSFDERLPKPFKKI